MSIEKQSPTIEHEKKKWQKCQQLSTMLRDLDLIQATPTKIVWMVDNSTTAGKEKQHAHILQSTPVPSHKNLYKIHWRDNENGLIFNSKDEDLFINCYYDAAKEVFSLIDYNDAFELSSDYLDEEEGASLVLPNLFDSIESTIASEKKNVTKITGSPKEIAQQLYAWKHRKSHES
jgi:hypothetical protein